MLKQFNNQLKWQTVTEGIIDQQLWKREAAVATAAEKVNNILRLWFIHGCCCTTLNFGLKIQSNKQSTDQPTDQPAILLFYMVAFNVSSNRCCCWCFWCFCFGYETNNNYQRHQSPQHYCRQHQLKYTHGTHTNTYEACSQEIQNFE